MSADDTQTPLKVITSGAFAAALEELGCHVDLVARNHLAEGLAESLDDVSGLDILLPQASEARETLAALLQAKGVEFEEVDVETDPAIRTELMERTSGRTTLPQVFVGEHHLGGYDELWALERAGELDDILDAIGA